MPWSGEQTAQTEQIGASVPPKGWWEHLPFNWKLPEGAVLSHLASLCLCYHRIRGMPSLLSGNLTSKAWKERISPLTFIWRLSAQSLASVVIQMLICKLSWSPGRVNGQPRSELLTLTGMTMLNWALDMTWHHFILSGVTHPKHLVIPRVIIKLITPGIF